MNSGTQHQFEESTGSLEENQTTNQLTAAQSESKRHAASNAPSLSSGDFEPDYAALKYRRPRDLMASKMATGLGWFSIALGLAEVFAPRQLGEAIGVGERTRLLPALGLREIASGVGILSGERPAGAVWSRVGGDAVDLALLGAALFSPNAKKGRVLAAAAAVAGVTALDYICAQQLSENISDRDGNVMAPTTEGQPSGRRASHIL